MMGVAICDSKVATISDAQVRGCFIKIRGIGDWVRSCEGRAAHLENFHRVLPEGVIQNDRADGVGDAVVLAK
eukprot:4881485-Pleurochrysis_carterae.AAC.1